MSLPRTVKAVVFDMDGLLVDTEVVFREAFMSSAADAGHDMPASVFLSMIGTNDEGSRRILRDYFGETFEIEPFWAATLRRFYTLAEGGIALKTGVVEILDALDALEIPRAIATSSAHENVAHSLEPHGIVGRFQAVVARGDYARGKPAPDPFLTAASRLGIAPQDCLALEDSHNGVRAAHAAGMMTVMVPDLLDATEEMQTLCVRIARDLHEVRDMLQAQAAG
jgi:HAD superfamily hydrolase (TIGR01509 family)